MQYAASFASIGVIVILIAYTVQSTVTQVNKLSPFTSGTVQHSNSAGQRTVIGIISFAGRSFDLLIAWLEESSYLGCANQYISRLN